MPSDAELGGAGRAEEAAARVVGSVLHHAMRSSRRGGGRRADHPFPLVPRDPENLDRDPETLKRQTAYLASALNDPTTLNALHAARASATPDPSEVLNSLGQYLGVPGFEQGRSSGGAGGGRAETRPPPLAKGVLPEVAPGDHEAYLRKVAGWSPSTRRAPTTPPPDLDRRAHEDVPAMYFDETFNLSDPAVFRRALCPDDDDDDDPARTPAAPRAPAVSQALFGFAAQTRLGSHLDEIETSLVAAIGARSESFFEASSRLHELDAFVAETCDAIERTRRMLLDASAYATCARESVASLHSKRANLAALADAFEQLATVRECREDLDVLARAGDFGGALEACEDLRRLIAAPSLRGLRCLEDVARHADATEREVVDALVAEFVRAARVQPGSVGYVDGSGGDDDDDDDDDDDGGGGGGDWSPATTRAALAAVRAAARDAGMEGVASEDEDEDEDDSDVRETVDSECSRRAGFGPGEASAADARESLLPPLLALTRGATDRPGGGRIADAVRAWGRAAAADARACVRLACVACVGECAVAGARAVKRSPESVSGGGDGMIQRAIGDLPPSVFAVVVRAVTAALAGHFARADVVRSAVRSALGTAPRGGDDDVGDGQKNDVDDGQKNDDDDDAFGTRTDECARAACAALPAGERAAASAAASDAVLALTDAAQGAVARAIACNAAVGQSLAEFSYVRRAADDFLERAERLGGGRRCLALRATVAARCKDLFAARHAAFAAKLGGVLEAETWTAATPVPPEFQRVLDDVASLAEGNEGDENGDASSRASGDVAGLDALVFPNTGERVVPVGASLALLKMLRDHVAAAAGFPSLAPTAVHKTAELLRVFNSRTSQLVLGAGAMRTAGLRSITAKHLALATESVRLFALVAPLLSASLAPFLPESRRLGLLAEFDRTVADLAKHARELHAKTVGIMRDRLAHHSSRLPTIWCSRVFTERASSAGSSAGKEDDDEGKGEIEDAESAKGPSEFATALGKEIGTLRHVVAGTLCARDAAAVFDEVLAHFDECATGTLGDARRSVAKEWRAKMGDRGEGDAAEGVAAEGVAAEGGAEGVPREGDDASTSKEPPRDEEVRGLIALDGAALLERLGTLVNGGEGGDGAAGAPTLARFLSEL